MPRTRRTDLDARDSPRGRRPIGRVFAFRADPAMVQALLAMPNASDFIRKAITRSLEEPCPVCIGTGVVATGFRSQLERLEGHLVLRRCSCCATEYPGFCADVTPRLKGADRLRWELEVKRGEFLCAPCLERSPPCDTCGRPIRSSLTSACSASDAPCSSTPFSSRTPTAIPRGPAAVGGRADGPAAI